MHKDINWLDLSTEFVRTILFKDCITNEEDLGDYFQMMLM
jgi:hypothetical protein